MRRFCGKHLHHNYIQNSQTTGTNEHERFPAQLVDQQHGNNSKYEVYAANENCLQQLVVLAGSYALENFWSIIENGIDPA